MKILMANKYLYPRAGAETYMLSLAEELIACGHEVMFFGMEHPDNYYTDRSVCLDAIDFSVSSSRTEMLINIVRAAGAAVLGKNTKKLDSLISSFKPDIIHAHNIYNQISPRIFSKAVKTIPVVMTLHDFKPVCPSYNCFVDSSPCTRCLNGGYYNCILKKCVQGSVSRSLLAAGSAYYNRLTGTYKDCYSGYIAPSRFLKGMMVESGIEEKRITVVKNIATGTGELSEPGKSIFYAGRLCEEKGLKTLIEAYSMLDKPEAELRIAGIGPDEAELKRYAQECGADVAWLGRLEPAAIREELAKCMLTVTPSIWFENCSISILESLVSGRVCIASDSGGNPELIADGKNGWIFEAGNSRELFSKLELALSMERAELLRMSEFAYSDSAQKYCKSGHVEAVIQTYNKLIEEYNHE